MRVTEIDNQHLSFATHTAFFTPLVEVAILNHADSYQVVLSGVEFNAGNMHVWRVARVLPHSFAHAGIVYVTLVTFSLFTKHFKVVLKYVDNFIRLECLFDAVSDSVNKPV